MSGAQFLLGVVRAHRWSAGCSDASASAVPSCDDIEFLLPRTAAAAADSLGSPPASPSAAAASVPLPSPLATPEELLGCAQMLVASLGNAASTGGANARSIYLDDNGYSDDDNDDDDEEQEIFNREVDAIGFRDLNLGHADDTVGAATAARPVTSPATAKRLLGAAGDEIGIFFHLPAAYAKALSVMGIAVPDPRCKRAYFVQQHVRFLVLLTNVPFYAYVRAKLQVLAAQFFRDDEPLDSFDALTAFYRTLTTAPSALAELPCRELFIGLPVVPLVRRLGADVIAVLRVLLLEGRIVCYSSNASLASSAPLALLALLPGVLSVTSCDYTSRTIQAVVYRLRRFGMPLSLFNEDFALQPCFTSDQAARVYGTKGFLVGTSDPLLLKHPSACVDVVVNLDLRQVVAFPTKKTEHAFALGAATTAFADNLAERLGRSSSGSSLSFARGSSSTGGSRTRSMRQSMRDIKTRTLAQLPPSRSSNSNNVSATAAAVVATPMQAAHANVDWVLAQFQSYFEHMLDDAFTSLVASATGGDDVGDEPYHPSIRALLEDLAKPLFGDHAKFVAEYGRGWTHAWQTTSNYDNWLSAHRLERRRSSVAAPLAPPPQDGRAKYTYPNGDEYDGCFRHGKRHGFGVYTEFVTKHQYEGDWLDDMRHGNGILSSKHHGYIYDGEWQHDMRSGRGHSSLKNAESYTGEWRDNCFHGTGVYMNASGDLYDGEWRNGVRDGVGKLTVARPKPSDEFGGLTQYRGEWRRGKFHGTGTAVYLDASEYSGGFEDGKRHGNGTLTFASGDRYEGQWWRGYRHGEGAMYSAKSGATREGTWKKDVEVDGVWFIVYANGDKYTGECRRGRPWGEGICKHANQSSYSGGWVDGLREGFGVCINADGSILEGEWKNSVYVKPVRAPSKFVDVPLSAASTPSLSRNQSASDRRRQLSVFSQQHPESGSHEHVYPNGDTYDGEFSRGMRHGFGVFTERASGNVYEGEWRENVRHGSGVLTSGMKDFIYDGAWEHDVRSGHGHCVIRGCETYSGQWKHNQFHGIGTYIDAEGHVYEGEFAHGKKHGVGKQVAATLPEKEQYSGEWKCGARDGVGDAVFADGSTYSGSWRADVRDGEGTFIAAGSSGDKYVGQWRNGMRDGAGILYVGSTGVVKEGVWSQDEPMDGEWTIQFPDGSKFTGACVKSRPHGRGVCKYANGDLYDGEWVNGKRHGVGTGFFANGESFVGEWENNHVALNGCGKLTLADGTVHVYTT